MPVSSCQDILDAWVLVENKAVTYRLLSRLMRIHVDKARELMAEWHDNHPRSHATYLLYGQTRRKDDLSQVTSSSPAKSDSVPPSSSIPMIQSVHEPSSYTIKLTPQEDLEKTKLDFISILSCQIYSVEPARLTDASLLIGCKFDIAEAMRGQSTKIADLSRIYGVIFNAEVHELDENPKRRVVADREVKPIMKIASSAPAKPTGPQPATIKQESSNASVKDTTADKFPMVDKKVPVLKRNASSSLASAFAKTPKPKVKPIVKSASVEQKAVGPIGSEGIAETDAQELKRKSDAAALKQMMMEEDEEDDKVTSTRDNEAPDDAPPPNVSGTNVAKVDEDMLDVADWSASDSEMKEAAPAKSVEPVKRRTKKKVKKQVHTKDAKGYMVTKEEWEWVSCDEDEVTVPATVKQTPSTSSKNKLIPKKKAAPGGIANYFMKK